MKIRICIWGLALINLVCFGVGAFGVTYIINPDGSGDYPTVRAAVDIAEDGDIIELGDGTFTGRGNKDIDFLGKAITIRSQSGNAEACIIDVEGENNLVSERGFVFINGEGNSSVLSDLTIINGDADAPCPNCDGGGVFAEHSSPTISNIIFINNFAAAGGAIGVVGGSPLITTCRFINNEAFNGGALYFFEGSAATIDHCLLYDNQATSRGGGISAQTNSALVTIINCTLANNQAPAGAGIEAWESEFAAINTIISFNSPSEAIYIYESPSIALSYSDIYGNGGGDWIGGIADQLGQSGNISNNPQFADTANGDYHLTPGSPCIDTGDPNFPIDPDNSRADIGALFFDHNSPIVEGTDFIPDKIALLQNYPNPFNAGTTIKYSLPQPHRVVLKIYDMLGREIRTLVNEYMQPGIYAVEFDGSLLASGVYFCILQADDYLISKPLLLLK